MCFRANPSWNICFFFGYTCCILPRTEFDTLQNANFRERKSALFTTRIIIFSHLQVGAGNCCQLCFSLTVGKAHDCFCTTTNTYQICNTTYVSVLVFFYLFSRREYEHQLKQSATVPCHIIPWRNGGLVVNFVVLVFGRRLWKRPHRVLTFISKIKLYFMLHKITKAAYVNVIIVCSFMIYFWVLFVSFQVSREALRSCWGMNGML